MWSILKIMGLWLIAFAGLVYLGIMTWMWFIQDSLMFPRSQEVLNTPEEVGLAYQDIRFSSLDGTPLHGWYIPNGNPDVPVLLFYQGNKGNVGYRLESLKRFHDMGVSVFVFQYSSFAICSE